MARGYRLCYMRLQALLHALLRAGAFTVAGHSLGAGVAAVLALLLRRAWRDTQPAHVARLRCFALAPPGGLLSRGVAEASAAFTNP